MCEEALEGGAPQTRHVVTCAMVDELLELRHEVCQVVKHQVHNAKRGTRWRCNRIAFIALELDFAMVVLGSWWVSWGRDSSSVMVGNRVDLHPLYHLRPCKEAGAHGLAVADTVVGHLADHHPAAGVSVELNLEQLLHTFNGRVQQAHLLRWLQRQCRSQGRAHNRLHDTDTIAVEEDVSVNANAGVREPAGEVGLVGGEALYESVGGGRGW